MDTKKRNDIINYLTDTDIIKTCVDYQAKGGTEEFDNKDDIIQDCWLWILTYDENKLEDAYDKKHINALITGYLKRQLWSTQSPYYGKYKRYKERTTDITKEVMELPEDYDFRFRTHTRGTGDNYERD